MPSFTRIKDRPTPYQPVATGTHQDPVIHKHTPPSTAANHLTLEEFQWNEGSGANGEENKSSNILIMDPYRTTRRNREIPVVSTNESRYRNETSPSVVEMLKMREILLKQKFEEERKLQQKLLRKKQQQEQLMKLEEAIKSNQLNSFEFEFNENDQNLVMNDGDETHVHSEDQEEEEEFKRMALFMKERRIVRQMQSNLMHIPLSNYRIFKYSIDAYLFGGKRYGPFTEILPWLYIGRGSIAKEERFFNSLGFTHIMNCTREIPNYFPAKFIYQRIPIDDSVEEDAGAKFPRAIEFLSRVFRCKGKVYVHCTMGASRAPAMVMAYLIARRQISLLDSLRYIQALRSVVQPNAHFLFQLAQLELQQGLGSSVIYRKEWRQYEFNAIRNQIDTFRKAEGVYKTCWRLHTKENAQLDMPPKTQDDLLDL